MPDSVYKVIELTGTSNDSWEKAAANAVGQAAKSLRDLRIAEVVKLDMQLDEKGNVEAYRAKLNVSFEFEGQPRHLAPACGARSAHWRKERGHPGGSALVQLGPVCFDAWGGNCNAW